MKKHSLSRITLLTIVTLGLYELVWLAQTRNQMVSKYHAKIPSASYAIALKALQLIGFIAVVVIVFHFIPASERANQNFLNSRVKPSAACFGEYNQSARCRQEIDQYTAPISNSPFILLGVALALIAAAAVIYWLYMRRWVVAYALGVQKVTEQKLPATVTVLALGGMVPILGMLHVQKAFNQT